jgi:hypothetical protein
MLWNNSSLESNIFIFQRFGFKIGCNEEVILPPCFQKTVKELGKIHKVVGGGHPKNVRPPQTNLVGTFVFKGRILHFVRFLLFFLLHIYHFCAFSQWCYKATFNLVLCVQ